MTTPTPHQSTARPYSLSSNTYIPCKKCSVSTIALKWHVFTSGAKYSGVPQMVLVVSPYVIPSLQRPKSVSLMWPSLSSNRFSSWRRERESIAIHVGINELENCKYMYTYMLLNIIDGVELYPSLRGGKANVRGHADRQTHLHLDLCGWRLVHAGSLLPWWSLLHRTLFSPQRKPSLWRDGRTAPRHSHTPSQSRDDHESGMNTSDSVDSQRVCVRVRICI